MIDTLLDAFTSTDDSPLVARTSGGPRERRYFVLPLLSSTTDLEAVRQAIQAHYEASYGDDVLVRAERLCSTWDEEDQTMHHLLTVEAACHHGCSARTVVEVVLQRESQTQREIP